MSRSYQDDLKIILRNEFRNVMKKLHVVFVDKNLKKYQEDIIIDAYIESLTYHIGNDDEILYTIEEYIRLSLEYNEENAIMYES